MSLKYPSITKTFTSKSNNRVKRMVKFQIFQPEVTVKQMEIEWTTQSYLRSHAQIGMKSKYANVTSKGLKYLPQLFN